jgi:ABC-type dipeptide/oligopeptide/nickel transport system permease subunit
MRLPARRRRSAPRPRRSLMRQPAAVAALGWLAAVVACAALAPLLAPAGPAVTQPSRALLPPGPGGLMGTDFLGRSVAARLVWGGRLTLAMGAGALALAIALGLPAGLAAGSMGGWADSALMRLADGLLAFPGLLLAMAVLAVLGVGLGSVTLAVGLAAAPAYARIARSVTREMRIQPYIEAAHAIGASRLRVAVRHVLPNAAPALVAFAGAQLGWILLTGAALSYLGLGAAPGTPEWGMMLADGRGYLRDAPWASVFPGLALTLTVLAANLLGDAWQTSQVR